MNPLKNNLIVKVDKAAEKSTGGILLATQWKDLPPTGTVEAVGPDVKEPLLKKGARVLFSRYSSVEVSTDRNSDLRIISEDGIWAVINDGKKS